MTDHKPDAMDRSDVLDAVHAWSTAIDNRDWDLLGELLTDPVRIDYSSMGADAESMAPQAWVERLQVLHGFDATLHATSNHVIHVTDDKAVCTSYVSAYHFITEGERDYCAHACGTYVHGLVRDGSAWKIESAQFNLAGYPAGRAAFNEAFRRARARATETST